MSEHKIKSNELFNILNTNYKIDSLTNIDCENIINFFDKEKKSLKCTNLNHPVQIFYSDNNENKYLSNLDIFKEYLKHLEIETKHNKNNLKNQYLIQEIEKFSKIITQDIINDSLIYNNILKKEDKYSDIFCKSNFEERACDKNWNELNLKQKAGFITEYIGNNWEEKNVEDFIKFLNDNPNEFSIHCSKDIWNKIKDLKNNKNTDIAYNIIEKQFSFAFEPRDYSIEVFYEGNNKPQIYYSYDFNSSKDFLNTLKNYEKTYIHGEIKENNKTNKLLYELNSQREIDYINKTYQGNIDPVYFTNLYNNTKKNTQQIDEKTSQFILDYLNENNLSIIKPDKSKETLLIYNNTTKQSHDIDISQILITGVILAEGERIEKILENKKLISEGKFNGVFVHEGTLEMDKKKEAFIKILENYRCENLLEWQEKDNQINKLNSQKNFLSINNLTFIKNYQKTTLNTNDKKDLFEQKLNQLTDEQKKEIYCEQIKKAEQMIKLNELTNHNGRK